MKHLMLLTILGIAVLTLTQCTKSPTTVDDDAAVTLTHEDTVKRGEYLVTIMGCHDCHTPKRMGARGPEPIPELLLSGYPGDRPFDTTSLQSLAGGWVLLGPDLMNSVGPWGASFSANLTSDETGVGNWTYEQFKTALTQGKYKGLPSGRTLLPHMPWQNYVNIHDEDLSAIFAFLKSTKPVKNVPPPPIPPDQLMKQPR